IFSLVVIGCDLVHILPVCRANNLSVQRRAELGASIDIFVMAITSENAILARGSRPRSRDGGREELTQKARQPNQRPAGVLHRHNTLNLISLPVTNITG